MKKIIFLFLTLTLILSTVTLLSGCKNKNNENNTDVGAGEGETFPTENELLTFKNYETMNYWLYMPSGADFGMPLVVYLHGEEYNRSEFNKIFDNEGLPFYLKNSDITCNAIVVIPKLPSGKANWDRAAEDLISLVSYLSALYKSDDSKTVLTGHGAGADGVFDIAVSIPGVFSSIAPIDGSFNYGEEKVSLLSGIRVIAIVSDNIDNDAYASCEALFENLTSVNQDAELIVMEETAVADSVKAYVRDDIRLMERLIG